MKEKLNRRKFLKNAGIASAFAASPFFISNRLFGAPAAANEKINVGIIGLGKQSQLHLINTVNNENCMLTAICDVDDARLKLNKQIAEKAYAEKNIKTSVKTFKDFRALIADKSVDAVMIVTPDHWHAIISVLAARAGKHVYCEKPLTFTIQEGQMVVDAVKKSGVVFQTGSQQRSEWAFRKAVQLARSGKLGDIKVIWCDVPKRFPYIYNRPEEEIPAGMDWEMWVGPAPMRPYTSSLLPPLGLPPEKPYAYDWPEWRYHSEYGNGMQADWGAHHYDIAQWGLNMDGKGPKYVEVFEEENPEYPLDTKSIIYTYENGTKVCYGVPKIMKQAGQPNAMVTFVGTEGVASASRGGRFWANTPALRNVKLGEGGDIAEFSEGHPENFFNAILTGKPVVCPVEVGASSCNMCIIGNIAHKLGRNLEWDWRTQTFVGDKIANSFLMRKNRGQWSSVWGS